MGQPTLRQPPNNRFLLRSLTVGAVRPARHGLSRCCLGIKGPGHRLAVVRRHRQGKVRTGNGVISRVAQGVAGIGGNGHGVTSNTSTVAGVGNWVGKEQKVRDNGDNHNHIEEVIHSNNDRHDFPASTGRLELSGNRQ